MVAAIEVGPLASTISGDMAALAARLQPSVALIYQGHGNGAGTIWRPDGQIVTNNHVARGERVEVVLADGRHFVGLVARRSPDRDLAVVKIAADDLPAVAVGDSATVRPGQLVFAIGHPLGYRDALTAGIIVAAGQAATGEGPRTGDFLQADVMLAPGSSGGPLFDANGGVIGIATMVNGKLSLAIPSQAVEHFMAGDVGPRRAFLGVQGTVVPLRRDDFPTGFLLTEIVEGSPADRAGLILGDLVVKIGERAVTDQESVPAALLRLQPGAAVPLLTLRGGEPRTFTVVPTERGGA